MKVSLRAAGRGLRLVRPRGPRSAPSSARFCRGFGGGGSGVLRVDDSDLGSCGVRTILGSGLDGSYQIMQGLEARVETPLSFERLSGARGGARGATGRHSLVPLLHIRHRFPHVHGGHKDA